ncbi:hypothetical protein GUJ93_ZPchr0007g6125 [Zizania palustris]|uniref:Uncharacterized protein n=1 Tax=Zizania palustris TaxID=103762 RepID=A0A8J5W5I4_ZIZPA|nr:hypothetical protein GUJ93_ZPchr0007g6125 [Zizania palustris]
MVWAEGGVHRGIYMVAGGELTEGNRGFPSLSGEGFQTLGYASINVKMRCLKTERGRQCSGKVIRGRLGEIGQPTARNPKGITEEKEGGSPSMKKTKLTGGPHLSAGEQNRKGANKWALLVRGRRRAHVAAMWGRGERGWEREAGEHTDRQAPLVGVMRLDCAGLGPPLAVAGVPLHPRRPHRCDRKDLANLGHPSIADEPHRISLADEDPNIFATSARHRPRSINPKPLRRALQDGIRADLTIHIYQVHSYSRHYEGFVRELRMMLTFLGFLFEPEFQGVYLEEFAEPNDISLTIHGSREHLLPYTTALGGPTFDVACQRVALQALMELMMIYNDRLQNSSLWLVPKRTPSAYCSIYLGVHSIRDPVMAWQSRLLQAMDDLHTEAVLDADEHHEAVEFLCEETKNLIQQNGELQRKIMQLQKDIMEMVPLLPRKRKPIREPAPNPKRIPPHPSTTGPSTSSAPAPRPGLVSDPIIENFLEPTIPREPRTRGSESAETASGGE